MADGGGLEVETDWRFQTKFWTFQRLAWGAMALLILAALAGLTGKGGYYSRATSAEGGASITYPRVARWQAADQLVVKTGSGAARASVFLPREFLDQAAIEAVTPEPSGVTALNGGQLFDFALAGTAGSKTIAFSIRPSHPGFPVRSYAAIDGGRPLPMSFIVLP